MELEWEDVKYDLPEDGQQCLIYTVAGEMEIATWKAFDGWEVRGYLVPYVEVTHWMELFIDPPITGKIDIQDENSWSINLECLK